MSLSLPSEEVLQGRYLASSLDGYYRPCFVHPAELKSEVLLVTLQGHRGVVLNEPIGALAHLEIGRAYALQGDTAKAKAAYQDFLTLWERCRP
jgi:hypothetical protein